MSPTYPVEKKIGRKIKMRAIEKANSEIEPGPRRNADKRKLAEKRQSGTSLERWWQQDNF